MMNQQPQQVYIAADALVTSMGFTTQENLEAIRNYRTGIYLQADGRVSDTPILAGMIDDARFRKEVVQAALAGYTRLEQLFILTIKQIISQTGVSPADAGCRLILATTKGNIDLLGEQTDVLDERAFLATMAERIGRYFHASHTVEVVSNACISGVSALIVGKRMIEAGVCKNVIVAGGDILSHFITSGFLAFKSVSQDICRPYDARRDGLNLGEACGAILLSSGEPNHLSNISQHAAVRSDYSIALSGGAVSNDANHISGPSRTGDGLYFAIRQAMEEASATVNDISFINTHGTATVYNDEMESKAIHLAGLQDAPVHSLKSYFGHTLGAAGVVESIICLHELLEGTLFGTLGYEEAGVSMPIKIQSAHQPLPMRSCVKTASGFGGCNAAIVLSLQNAQKESLDFPTETRSGESPCNIPSEMPRVSTSVQIENSEVRINNVPILTSESKEFAPFIREAFKNLHESNLKFYKMSDLCKLGYVAAGYLLQGRSFAPQEIGILLANASASLDTDIEHQVAIDKDGDEAASPATFVYTLPNTVAGEICIRHKIQGENTFFIAPTYDEEKLTTYAHTVMRKGRLKACIVGWCELLGERYKAEFKLIEIESWKN